MTFAMSEIDSVRTSGQAPNAAGGFLAFALLLILVPIGICMARGGQTCIGA